MELMDAANYSLFPPTTLPTAGSDADVLGTARGAIEAAHASVDLAVRALLHLGWDASGLAEIRARLDEQAEAL